MRLVPTMVYAREGDRFWIDALPLGIGGGHLTSPTLRVEWEVPNGITLDEERRGAWISVTSLAGAGSSSSGEVRGITASAGGKSTELKLQVSNPGGSGSGRDWLEVAFTLTGGYPPYRNRPAIALMDAESDNGCEQDEVYPLAWGGFLTDNMVDGCGPEGNELALFSSQGGSVAREGGGIFTSNQDHLVEGMYGAKEVELVFWDWAERPPNVLYERMKQDLQSAQEAFDRSGAGIHLLPAFPPNGVPDRNRWIEYDGPECSPKLIDTLDQLSGGELTKGTPPQIHVFYVHELGQVVDAPEESDGRTLGAFCYWSTNQAPAILISASKQAIGTLAHELGHVLGLNSRAFGSSGGHTMNYHGFDSSNLMREHTPWPRGTRAVFTLGQVYRMHYDPRSWLYQTQPSTFSQNCQSDPYADDPCPDLRVAAWGEEGDTQ